MLRLSQEGFAPDSEGYLDAMKHFEQTVEATRANARKDAIIMGGAEQARQFGMGMEGSQFALDQNLIARKNYRAARQRQAQSRQGLMSGLGSIAQTVAPMVMTMSDERLKSNIVKIGDHPVGVGIYKYEIFGEPDVGVLAQELQKVHPELVHTHPSGYLMVDYGGLEKLA